MTRTPTLRQQIRAELARRELARREALGSFAAFVRQAIAAGVVQGIAKVQWGRHLEAICLHTQMQLEGWLVCNGHGSPDMVQRQADAWASTGAQWEDGEPMPWLRYPLVQNQIINIPPGTLKSTIVMVLANAWIWLHCPTYAFGAASGIEANVGRDSLATRDLVGSDWYRSHFRIEWSIRRDKDSVGEWRTTSGGARYSRTVGAGFTGLHVDGTFIDDPDDADRVWNEAARLATQNRFTRAIENRVIDEQRSTRLVLQQRVHAQDFTAYLCSIARWAPDKRKGWAQLSIPAELGFNSPEAPEVTPYGWRDWRTEHGELLHERFTAEILADKREKLGTNGYEGQYNQNPQSLGAGMFARRHARFFVLEGTNVAPLRRRPDGCPSRADQPPVVVALKELSRLTLSVDAMNSVAPISTGKTSAVGLVVAGCRGEERFVLDDRTRVLGPSDTYRAIYELIAAWPLDRILVEAKALGPGVIDEIRRAIRRGWYLGANDEQVQLVGPDGRPTRAVVEETNPGKDSKEQRAHGMLPPWEQGLILLLDGAPWLYPQVDANRKTVDEGHIGEVCSFPSSRRSDRVDALSQLVGQYRGSNDARERFKALSRV